VVRVLEEEMIKEIELSKWILSILLAALLSAGGLLFAKTHEKIDTKANKETVTKMLKHAKEDRMEQKQISKEMLKVIQDLTVQIAILNERNREKKDNDN